MYLVYVTLVTTTILYVHVHVRNILLVVMLDRWIIMTSHNMYSIFTQLRTQSMVKAANPIISFSNTTYVHCTCFNNTQDYMYRIVGNFRQEKISPKPGPMYCRKNSPDLFSRSLDWAKLNSNVIYI